LHEIIENVSNFNEADKNVALELIDIATNNPSQTDYTMFVAESEGAVLGYYCIGLRPLTDGVYDLYWIVTNPAHQGKGVGKQLINHALEYVKMQNGRWLLAETSSLESYADTRGFYDKCGFSVVATIPQFYKANDDLLIYGIFLTNLK